MTPRPNLIAAYAAGIAGIALFSIMDMVMKGLTIAIGVSPGTVAGAEPARPDRGEPLEVVIEPVLGLPVEQGGAAVIEAGAPPFELSAD